MTSRFRGRTLALIAAATLMTVATTPRVARAGWNDARVVRTAEAAIARAIELQLGISENNSRDFVVRLVPARLAGRLVSSCLGYESNEPYWLVSFRADRTTYRVPPKNDGNGYLYNLIRAADGWGQQGFALGPEMHDRISRLGNHDLTIPTLNLTTSGSVDAEVSDDVAVAPIGSDSSTTLILMRDEARRFREREVRCRSLTWETPTIPIEDSLAR
jgi:hypothetical protein